MTYDDYIPQERSMTSLEKELEQKLDHVADFFQTFLDAIYGSKEIDEVTIDSAMEEMCHLLRVKMPQGDVNIRRKKKNIAIFDCALSMSRYQMSIAQ